VTLPFTQTGPGEPRRIGGHAAPDRPITLDDLLARKTTALRASADTVGETTWRPEDDVDWSRLALRLRTAIELDEDLMLEVVADGAPALVIDVPGRTFWWPHPISEFPMRVRTLSITPIDLRSFDAESAGNDLEPLLWQIAHASFQGERAHWLKPNDRYRLRRWPNLTLLPHDTDQVQAMSVLGQASLTAQEFTAIAGLEPLEAGRLLSALSLMGLLRVQPSTGQSFAPPLAVAPKRPGLLSKLRGLFGR
jgi:hypothetical protein